MFVLHLSSGDNEKKTVNEALVGIIWWRSGVRDVRGAPPPDLLLPVVFVLAAESQPLSASATVRRKAKTQAGGEQ